ncbi:acyltransferase [Caballeronia sp. dw_19]|uniref:acyltransferase family protein n=1 Tax=Caballeronia sp. dw_19 TaxID=2719791 RepID=UPI001BD3D136|nr:acyltransferase [Caballeronia sp. dw_19]
MMSPVSPLPVVVALLLALATVKALSWRFEPPKAMGRFVTIDGLRGYLAFFVFLHHSSVWYFYLKTGIWQEPPSNLFNHFGQSSVTLFFMITGFLFFTKIMDGKKKEIDWIKLYTSRVLRLFPLYLFSMILLFLTVAVLSKGVLTDSPVKLVISALRWLSFTVSGEPELNGIKGTANIVAGVTWTLSYEWCFYLCLPLLAIAIGAMSANSVLIIGIIGVLACVLTRAAPVHLAAFGGGILAALLVRRDWFLRIAASKVSSVIVVAAIIMVVVLFPTAYSFLPLILLTLSFALIAGGATVFGVLSNPLSRMFGEMAYSIYLLHGIVLFTLFNFIIGKNHAGMLSPIGYWSVISLTTPALILICFTTFNLIEKPAMQQTEGVARWVRYVMQTRRIVVKDAP